MTRYFALGFFLGLTASFLVKRRDPIFLDIVTGKRFYISEQTRAAQEALWRDLEHVDSV